MAGRRRRRTTYAIAASAAVHGLVLTLLAIHAPVLRTPPQVSGPPEPIIPVLIMPRLPPPAPGEAAPAPIRLHRRPQRFRLEELPVAPLPVPEARASAPAPREGDRRGGFHPAPLPESPKDQLRTVLRGSDVGCANTAAVGLNRAEREDCDERFGRGAKDAPFLEPGLGMTRAKRQELDAAAAAKSARRAAMEGPAPRPIPPEPSDYDGEPHITGAGESALGQATHPPSKRAAKRLGRLPP